MSTPILRALIEFLLKWETKGSKSKFWFYRTTEGQRTYVLNFANIKHLVCWSKVSSPDDLLLPLAWLLAICIMEVGNWNVVYWVLLDISNWLFNNLICRQLVYWKSVNSKLSTHIQITYPTQLNWHVRSTIYLLTHSWQSKGRIWITMWWCLKEGIAINSSTHLRWYKSL